MSSGEVQRVIRFNRSKADSVASGGWYKTVARPITKASPRGVKVMERAKPAATGTMECSDGAWKPQWNDRATLNSRMVQEHDEGFCKLYFEFELFSTDGEVSKHRAKLISSTEMVVDVYGDTLLFQKKNVQLTPDPN